MRYISLLSLLFIISACGQKGPLVPAQQTQMSTAGSHYVQE